MDPLIAKLVVLAGIIASIFIRLPHHRRSTQNVIVSHRKNGREKALLAVVSIGMMVLPVLYIFTGWPAFADYGFEPLAGWAGLGVMALAMWLFWKCHADLGRNWSPTLEVREGHTLVTGGVYRHIRHPMYTSIWLWSLAQLLLLPNAIVGPAAIMAFGLMYLLRVDHEEGLMLERFGDDYRSYMGRTRRIIPGFL